MEKPEEDGFDARVELEKMRKEFAEQPNRVGKLAELTLQEQIEFLYYSNWMLSYALQYAERDIARLEQGTKQSH